MQAVTLSIAKKLNKDNIDYVLYHGNCADGFASAFCVYLYYKQNYGIDMANKIEYIPCLHVANLILDDIFIQKLTGKNILMCDFSYKYNQLIRIIEVANSFMILDHHESAQLDLENIPSELKIFDMARSGAVITWDFLFPDTILPKVLSHIQDRDLWTKKIKGTEEFSTYLFEQTFSFELFESFLSEDKLESVIANGTAWLEYKQSLVSKGAKKAYQCIQKINNKLMIVLYVSSMPDFSSDVGNKVFDFFPLGDLSTIVSHNLENNTTYFSLRSTDDRQNVSIIAKQCGGGGHPNASGFSVSGIVGFLPFEHNYDTDILNVLKNKITGPLVYYTKNISNDELAEVIKKDYDTNEIDSRIIIEYEYTLFEVPELKKIWLEEDYLDLIKRKTSNSRYIVFQTPSDNIDYDEVSKTVIPLNNYYMYINEKNLTNAEERLAFNAIVSKEACLEVQTDKKFEDIFKIFLRCKNTVHQISESDSESDPDEIEI
jgi:oligoribonuclease NrnB/cAMP/cGMP phosphodiesterase (DHH superfamily)